ncbi:integrin [Persicimonas caeni]|uniref:Integrin n=1 Tax=Persicimonas caeni TaxID=2292766 RepID=A0A4Y6PM73_PERCE|nr:integrin [Persicimonas caeni]QDG49416.1 integrin [Persicimonas caeni]QED30637.1 integrin [Persicimonas caeni]
MKFRSAIRPITLVAALTLAAAPVVGCGGDDDDKKQTNNTLADTGGSDAGAEDTGSNDTGAEDTGSEDAAADDAGTEDTGAVDTGGEDTGPEDTGPALCAENERVEAGACVACDSGTVNAAGDDPTGPDTECFTDDDCYAVLGVDCEAYQEAYIKADSPYAQDFFGNAVDLSADGKTLVVGAFWDEPATEIPNFRSGMAYVFERDGTTWTQQAALVADNYDEGHKFGTSVAISGATIVVGATGVASSTGAAYVFDRDAQGDWIQTTMLQASNAGTEDEFGNAVDIDGDTIVVGAFKEDSKTRTIDGDGTNDEAPDSGAAYVFERDAQGAWAQSTYLKAANAGHEDWYGASVAIDGDTIAVGVRQDDSDSTGVDADASNNNLEDAGSVFVYTRDGQSWAQQAYIKASNAGRNDSFGYKLALAGDTLAVSAPGEKSGDSGVGADQNLDDLRTGAVYVFTRAGTSWSQQVYIKAPNNVSSYNPVFGQSIDLSASGDTLAVGAVLEGSDAAGLNGNMTNFQQSHTDSGAAYTFTRNAGTWTHDLYIKAPNSYGLQRFGQSLAISADADRLVVGAHHESGGSGGINGDMTDTSAGKAGAVYMQRIAR